MVSKYIVVTALDSKVETCHPKGFWLLSVVSCWCFNSFVEPATCSKACVTDGLLQALLLVLAGVLPRAKLKGALQRNIGKCEEDCCVFFKCDPHLFPWLLQAFCSRPALGLLVRASRFVWNFPWLPKHSDTFVAAPITKLLCFFSSLQSILEIADRWASVFTKCVYIVSI